VFPNLGRHLRRPSRRVLQTVCSKLYRDSIRDTSKAILVAGAGRSGSTWLAEIIGSQLSCRLMFEPFHSRLVEGYNRFEYFQYMRPSEESEPLRSFVESVFSGQIRNPWIDKYVERLSPQYRLIKEIRACLFLRWIHDRFREVPILFIVRHPCAVVASRMALGWATDGDIEPFLNQAKLVEDHLVDRLALIKNARREEEKHAIVWSVSNLVPMRQFDDTGLSIIYYEDMVLNLDRALPGIFATIGQPYEPSARKYADRASMMAGPNSAVTLGTNPITTWKDQLSQSQITNVLAIVEEFGLGHLYGDSDSPLIDAPSGIGGHESA
jgi:hypothetical protein